MLRFLTLCTQRTSFSCFLHSLCCVDSLMLIYFVGHIYLLFCRCRPTVQLTSTTNASTNTPNVTKSRRRCLQSWGNPTSTNWRCQQRLWLYQMQLEAHLNDNLRGPIQRSLPEPLIPQHHCACRAMTKPTLIGRPYTTCKAQTR